MVRIRRNIARLSKENSVHPSSYLLRFLRRPFAIPCTLTSDVPRQLRCQPQHPTLTGVPPVVALERRHLDSELTSAQLDDIELCSFFESACLSLLFADSDRALTVPCRFLALELIARHTCAAV